MADYIRPTPRNPILGLLADAMMGGLAYMEDPRRTQQMRGVGGLLSDTGIAQTVDRLASGEPLTKGKGFATRMKPETAAAAMTLAPEAVPIGRAAMAAARATKGLPVGGAIVYHGSPYRFNRFDPTKIGYGEGAQSYGYGHYVAQAQDVANEYANMPKFKQGVIENQEVLGRGAKDFINRVEKFGSVDKARQEAQELLAAMRKQNIFPSVQDQLATEIDLANRYGSQLQVKPTGVSPQLYTIDLPDEQIARMLDYDKPLSQQPDIVKRINPQSLGLTYKQLENGNHAFVNSEGKIIGNLQKGGTQESFTKNWTEDVLRGTGSDLYRQLGQGMEGGPKVSSALRQAGIPGIRYLDGGSRGAGQGTSNFVIFPGEEELLRILSVNGGLLGP
jgi:hypothetical protein